MKRDKGTLIVIICVDDLLIAANSDAMREHFMKALRGNFKIKEIGRASRAIGFDIQQSPREGYIKLHLSSYIAAAAARFSVDTSSGEYDLPAPLHLVRACFAAQENEKETERILEEYQEIVGVLLFIVTYVRVDGVSGVHVLTRFMLKPTQAHLTLARRVLSYFYATRTLGLVYKKGDSMEIAAAFIPGTTAPSGMHAATDSDWAVGPSTTAFVVMLAGAAIGWASRLQRCIALSTSEAEFYALSEGVAEVVHFRNLSADTGRPLQSPTVVFTDSRGARQMSMDMASSQRTRHIHRRWYFVCFHEDAGEVKIKALAGKLNFANCLSKCTGGKQFLTERAYLLGTL